MRRPRFEGGVQRNKFFGLSSLSILTSGCCVTRSHAVARQADPIYFLVYQSQGRSRMRQTGSEAELNQGDLTLIRAQAASEFDLSGAERNEQLCIAVPQRDLHARARGRPISVAERFDGTRGLGYFASQIIRSGGLTGDLTSYEQSQIISQLMDLLILMGTPGVGSTDGVMSKTSQVNLHQIKRLIERRLDDWTLTIEDIAGDYGLSVRQVQRLFQLSGTTFNEWVKVERLERCRRDLMTPELRGTTITDIAFRWGFNDTTHFSRAYRRHFGSSPREHRPAMS
jgi:AraC-like DNA-binding protein